MIQIQDFFVRWNDVRPFHFDLLNKITGNGSRWLMTNLANIVLPAYYHRVPGLNIYYQAQKENRVSNSIVSLTSFPARIGIVWLVVESLLRQTRVPRKIVIYLSKEQFCTSDSIPDSLKKYPSDVVEIKQVEGNIRSHKKYWYALEEYKSTPVIVVDDDLLYDSRLVEDLEEKAMSSNKVIPCCWGHRMKWNDEGVLLPYSEWKGKGETNIIANDFFFGSGGGTYFPKGSLEGARIDLKTIMKICPFADDIWLNAIVRKNGYKTCLIRDFYSMVSWRVLHDTKLHSINNGQNYNDVQLAQVREYFMSNESHDPFRKDKI